MTIKHIKETHLDKLFSKLIRGRTNGYCQRCETNHRQAHCSHLFSRRHRSTRWDETANCVCHCTTCHRYLTENPYKFSEWIIEHLGKEDAEALCLKAHTTRKRSQPQMRDLYEKMESQWAIMNLLRNEGFEGRIEFDLEGL